MTTIGKVAVTLGSVTGVTGVTVTSTLLSGSSDENNNIGPTEDISNLSEQQKFKPEVKKFKNPSWNHQSIPNLGYSWNVQTQTKPLPCINEYFKEINWNDGKASSEANFQDINDFPNDDKTISCLAVEYYKKTYSTGKWWGEFRLIWSVKNETNKQGFLTVVDVKTKDQGLYGNSAAYILKQQTEDTNKWTVSHSKRKEEWTIKGNNGNEELAQLIPRNGDAFWSEQLGVQWGFESDDIGICPTEDHCLESKISNTNHKPLNWKFSGGGTLYKLENWCENFRKWLNNNFGWGNFVDKINKVMGKWTEVPKVQTSTKEE